MKFPTFYELLCDEFSVIFSRIFESEKIPGIWWSASTTLLRSASALCSGVYIVISHAKRMMSYVQIITSYSPSLIMDTPSRVIINLRSSMASPNSMVNLRYVERSRVRSLRTTIFFIFEIILRIDTMISYIKNVVKIIMSYVQMMTSYSLTVSPSRAITTLSKVITNPLSSTLSENSSNSIADFCNKKLKLYQSGDRGKRHACLFRQNGNTNARKNDGHEFEVSILFRKWLIMKSCNNSQLESYHSVYVYISRYFATMQQLLLYMRLPQNNDSFCGKPRNRYNIIYYSIF